VAVGLGTVNGFVTAGRPASALLQPGRVIAVADEDAAVAGLLLEVALEAEIRVALREHPLVHRAVRRMATDAAFADCFVFEHERTALGGVALEAGFVVAEQRRAAALERLGQVRPAAFDGVTPVRVVTIGATDLALEHRMMVRQLESRAYFGVALETGGRRSSRIDDLISLAAALYVKAAWPVAGFTTHVLGVVSLRFESRMCRRPEVFRDRFMTGGAFIGADELSSGNTRRRHDRAARVEVAAGKQDQRSRDSPGYNPPDVSPLINQAAN
jgi:hypothetical protein